jgi:tetrahydromethanopterin S-methyltransferase subunit E
VTLYRLDLQRGQLTVQSKGQVRVQAPERFLIHFRFGAGLEVADTGAIRLFASDRNVDHVDRTWRLTYNEFGPAA